MRLGARCLIAVALTALIAPSVRAEDYPSRTITIVAPFPPGGPTDVGARALANTLGRRLNRSVIVDNVSGAGGNIGAARVAHATADGYTLMYTNFSLAISPAMFDQLSYDAMKDFASIGVVSQAATLLLARKDFPAANVGELLDMMKTRGDKILMATSGPGGPSDLCALLIMKSTGARFTIVPFKGTAPAMTDLAAGHVDIMCDSITTAMPQVKAGMVKTYGITGTSRSPFAPDLATLDEQGLHGVNHRSWSALYAPKRTPPAVIEMLSRAVGETMRDPEFRALNASLGQEILTGDLTTPKGADAFLAEEINRWPPLLKDRPKSN
jgi:tripartite-type tricarboxylate transporter receptor subunit TctC